MKIANHVNKLHLNTNGTEGKEWDLTCTKQINFFIGPNNSGKSRRLRELFKSSKDKIVIDSDLLSQKKFIEYLESLPTHLVEQYERRYSVNFKRMLEKYSNDSLEHKPIRLEEIIPELIKLSYRNTKDNLQSRNLSEAIVNRFKEENKENKEYYEGICNIKWESTYIPTLRNLRKLDDSDLFMERTKLDYFDKHKTNLNIFTGHSLYENIRAHLLGTHSDRELIHHYEKYLSVNFFYGQEISLVPRIDKDVVYFKEGDKEERPIYDLGDGIQSIIILTYPIFMASSPTMFFIEEPELYLHAGLQRTLIETYAKHEKHMFFITTHSNHFLDIAQERDDISIQQVYRNGDETIIQPSEQIEHLLTELGVRASSVLLANCSIWVEGITDKLYLRTYLNKYIKELRKAGQVSKANILSSYHENLHFVFTEYQGSNIVHWYFGDDTSSNNGNMTPAKKLNRNILLIADADIDSKGNRVDTLKHELGDSFYLLEWKEIENYIPKSIIIKTVESRWDTFNNKKECSLRLENLKSNSTFENASEGIGRILERYITKPAGFSRHFFSDNSGTIKDKVKFCYAAIKIMNDCDDDWELTPQLSALCEKIWEHVIRHNNI